MKKQGRKRRNYQNKRPKPMIRVEGVATIFIQNSRQYQENLKFVRKRLQNENRLLLSAAGDSIEMLIRVVENTRDIASEDVIETYSKTGRNGTVLPILEIIISRGKKKKKSRNPEDKGNLKTEETKKEKGKGDRKKGSIKKKVETKESKGVSSKVSEKVDPKKDDAKKNIEKSKITKKIDNIAKKRDEKKENVKQKKPAEEKKVVENEVIKTKIVKPKIKNPFLFGLANCSKINEEDTFELLEQVDFFLFAVQNCRKVFTHKDYHTLRKKDLMLIISKQAEVQEVDDEILKHCVDSQLVKIKINDKEFQLLHSHKFENLTMFKILEIIKFGQSQKIPTLIVADFGKELYNFKESKEKVGKNGGTEDHYHVVYGNRVISMLHPRNVVSCPCTKRSKKPTEHVLYFGEKEVGMEFYDYMIVKVGEEKLNKSKSDVAYLYNMKISE